MDTKALNGLRFLGAFIIAFIFHYPPFMNVSTPPFNTLFMFAYTHGYLMVELFFVLSGFGMYIGYADKIKNKEITFKEYMLKRLEKIYPLFFLGLILTTTLNFTRRGGEFFDLWHFIMNLCLCQYGVIGTDNSYNLPAWYMSVFFICYVAFYFIISTSKNQKDISRGLILLFGFGIIVFCSKANFPTIINLGCARGAMGFSIGCALALLYRCKDRLKYNNIGWGSFILLLVLYFAYRKGCNLGSVDLCFITVAVPLLVLSSLFCPLVNKIFSSKVFQLAGILSMPIFILHYPIRLACSIAEIRYSLNIDYTSGEVWLINVMVNIFLCILYYALGNHYTNLLKRIFNTIKNRIIIMQ